MAGKGSTNNGRESHSQRLGIKCFEGETVKAGSIILRQVGARFKAGRGAGMGTDYTIYARIGGKVDYSNNKVVSIIPEKSAE